MFPPNFSTFNFSLRSNSCVIKNNSLLLFLILQLTFFSSFEVERYFDLWTSDVRRDTVDLSASTPEAVSHGLARMAQPASTSNVTALLSRTKPASRSNTGTTSNRTTGSNTQQHPRHVTRIERRFRTGTKAMKSMATGHRKTQSLMKVKMKRIQQRTRATK